MQEEFDQAINQYFVKWDALVKKRKDAAFFESLVPFAAGWKVTDLAEFDAKFAELRDSCDLIFYTWLNERWATKMHLKEGTWSHGIEVLKLLQRRPRSSDPVGLDHIDFFAPNEPDLDEVLKKETDLQWEVEQNGVASWHSVRFDGEEAKLRIDTVWDTVSRELLMSKDATLRHHA